MTKPQAASVPAKSCAVCLPWLEGLRLPTMAIWGPAQQVNRAPDKEYRRGVGDFLQLFGIGRVIAGQQMIVRLRQPVQVLVDAAPGQVQFVRQMPGLGEQLLGRTDSEYSQKSTRADTWRAQQHKPVFRVLFVGCVQGVLILSST